ncbi:DUF2267 domain-containing protein [Xanthobacter autotrophicus]|uniref:DUF2267 domain-containing protein n=1 Tax=Xanthobacter autotrophicus TaxID=280 RepID=UPI0024A65A16|nr:DUF2267 domain-containing protein [Xanthobacter autotrophicus]MDI4659129.1 DUF2267 domain-containing protein [Xanthobacter autotrophicus]
MPIPLDLQHATEQFDRFLADARDTAGLGTRNQAYTMVDGVLRVFRRRLALEEAIRFAGVLPPVLRAMFVADWDPAEPRRAFMERAVMTLEVQGLRRHHNFAPPSAIRDVASALRRHVDEDTFDRVLATLPEGAAAFWAV